MQLFNLLALGLLGLASSPFQSLVAGAAVAPRDVQARAILPRAKVDWSGPPRLKMKDVSDKIDKGKTDTVDVTGDEGKSKLSGHSRVFYNTKDNPETQLAVYKDIQGKGISFDILAILTEDHGDDVVGFVQAPIEGTDPKKEDAAACKAVLNKLHEAGWLHGDPIKRNWKKVGGTWYTYDFEDAKKVDPDDSDDEMDKNMDNVKLQASFDNPFPGT